jgi:GT2 family glycosyltransferase
MTIHVTVVAYALADDLLQLYESCAGRDVRWHVFLHSDFPPVVAACTQLARDSHVSVYPYRVNRGLARSWNEGLLAADRARAEFSVIANDDAYAAKGDLHRLAQAAAQHPDAFMVSGMGFDVRENTLKDQRFALAVINPIALQQVGCFDENLWPIYFEDVDWCRRADLLGLSPVCVGSTHIVHAGSKTLYTAGDMDTHHRRFAANQAYYSRKWGGAIGAETFARPFDHAPFGGFIPFSQRHHPYPGFNRNPEEIRP